MNPKPAQEGLMLEDQALRDGLQMEARMFSLEEKLHLFRLMQNAGVKRIQVGSFVHPEVVPPDGGHRRIDPHHRPTGFDGGVGPYSERQGAGAGRRLRGVSPEHVRFGE